MSTSGDDSQLTTNSTVNDAASETAVGRTPGFNTVSPYLIVDNSVEAGDFYQKAFGAEVGMRMPGPDGQSTMHMEMRLGDSTIMMTDANPQWNAKSPKSLGGTPVSLHVYVKDADALFQRREVG